MIIDWEAEQDRMVYPQGTYKVIIDDFEHVTASTGTEQIRWKAKIVEPEEHKDRTIVDHTALTEKAIWRLQKLVKAAGLEAKSLGKTDTTSPQFEVILNACKGRKMFWAVGEELDNKGLPRNSINDYVNDLDQEPIKVGDDTTNIAWNE